MQINSAIPTPAHAASSLKATTALNGGEAAAAAQRLDAASQPETADTRGIERADFSRMTRQELADWMNSQIRSGQMTLDESSPFLAMTIKISASTGGVVDMAGDTERIDFLSRARAGLEGALSRHDHALAERLRNTIDIMQRGQDRPYGIEARA